MDCSEIKEVLSAYYDEELSSDVRAAVEEHLSKCENCARELEGFLNLSVMAGRLTNPEPPSSMWQQLEEQLANQRQERSERRTSPKWLGVRRKKALQLGIAIAAAILIAVGWFGYKTWFTHHSDHQLASVFGEYLEEFPHNPEAAQRILLSNYPGQAVDAQDAIRTVGYRPAVADGLPAGYKVDKTYAMKMPCCKCVQCLCRRNDGSTIAIFEHDNEEDEWYGHRAQTQAICGGKRCKLVELDKGFVATWQLGKRHLTVVGMHERPEVDRLVAWFDERRTATQ